MKYARLLLGVTVLLLGLFLVLRPLASLGTLALLIAAALAATGVTELLGFRSAPRPWLQASAGAALLAAGVVVLVWTGVTIHALAVVVGVALVVSGLVRVYDGWAAGAADARIAALTLGLATVLFGAVALAWPDVTLVVVAVVFGARTAWFGLTTISAAVLPDGPEPAPSGAAAAAPPGRLRRFTRVTAAVLTLVVALTLVGVSAWLRSGTPTIDAFYTAPREVPSRPGQLLRAEPFTKDIPSGARAWRVLYTTTTTDDHTHAVASAIVVVPTSPGPHPVIAWAHGTTGFAPPCAPSLAKDPFGSGAFYLLDQVVAQGWALVATDYTGLGTAGPQPYLIGPGEGRSVLDAVRAAEQLDPSALAHRTVVWGHSQGGHAALWTGILAPTYAPDDHVVGVAALAPASDLIGLMGELGKVPGGSIFASYVMAAYTQTYGDVSLRRYVRPGAQAILTKLSGRCLAEPSVLVSVLSSLSLTKDPELFARDPATGALGRRLRDNIPSARIEAPLLIAQGGSDGLVLPTVQHAYVAARCAAGQPLDYLTYAGRGHVPLVEADSPLVPDLLRWTADRLAGRPAPDTCSSLP